MEALRGKLSRCYSIFTGNVGQSYIERACFLLLLDMLPLAHYIYAQVHYW